MTSTTSRIPLAEPSLSGNEWKYVKDCLDQNWISSAGSYVVQLEDKIREYVQTKHAVAVVNGTSALHLALILAGVKREEEVIVPTLTFIAPINAVAYAGASPIFMDCDEQCNLDPKKLAQFCEYECTFDPEAGLSNKQTGKKIRAVMIIHTFGHPVNIEPIKDVCERYRLILIEDATESLGSRYTKGKFEGRHTGTIGDIGCYSFNGNKIVTCGGGGMLVTSSKEFAQKGKYLTTQAKDDPERFIHNEIGYNYRLSNIHSAIGCAQMEQLDHFVEIKRANFSHYENLISKIDGLRLIQEPAFGYSNHWAYTLCLDPKKYPRSRDQVLARLKENNVEARPIWELNHRQVPYRKAQTFRIERAIEFHNTSLNLPCSTSLKKGDIEKICDLLKP